MKPSVSTMCCAMALVEISERMSEMTEATDPWDAPVVPPEVVSIDVGRQLFVDDYLIETTDCERTYHMPEKYTGNPVLKPETALELNEGGNAATVSKGGGVWWVPAEQVFKMWYEAGWIGTICLATSRDGIHWERPEFDVNPGTNQVLPPDVVPDSWSVVPDWDAVDPEQRYKMFLRGPDMYSPAPSRRYQRFCMTSPDGIHWGNRVNTGDCGDRSTLFYNPFRKKWVFSLRAYDGARSRRYWEADDFLEGAKWEDGEPRKWVAADELDLPDPEIGMKASLYNLDAVAYESLMLGMFEIHRGPENGDAEKTGLPKITELNFAYSRDGFHWHRPDRRAHIPAERRDVWDRGYVQSVSSICTVRGDKLWIYYTGFQGDATKRGPEWLSNGMYDRGATGVAFLRRDGFASMDAGPEAATLTTHPVRFSGQHLFVNADVPDGSLQVEVINEDGHPIEPFTLAQSVPFKRDDTCQHMTWKSGADLSVLKGNPVRFRFAMTNGSLFAFWVSCAENGRSDGYVAGGGPGYTGMTDTVGCGALEAELNIR